MLTVGLLVFLLMWPFFGFLDALVLGLIAGVFEAVPYLGPLLSAVPAFFSPWPKEARPLSGFCSCIWACNSWKTM
jgi:predicted PurR-regulated permease PerM